MNFYSQGESLRLQEIYKPVSVPVLTGLLLLGGEERGVYNPAFGPRSLQYIAARLSLDVCLRIYLTTFLHPLGGRAPVEMPHSRLVV